MGRYIGTVSKDPFSISGMFGVPITKHSDNRGLLAELFNRSISNNTDFICVRTLYVRSFRGVIRGLHVSNSQNGPNKFISCTRGEVFEVYLDLRRGSTTYLKIDTRTLSAENPEVVYIPTGVAHGYQCLTDEADLIYQLDNEYSADQEISLNPIEARLNFAWPLENFSLSKRDLEGIGIQDFLQTRSQLS